MVDSGGSEPGFINQTAATARAPWFKGCNPCAEILLGNSSFCNLFDLDLGKFKGDAKLDSKELYTLLDEPTTDRPVSIYLTAYCKKNGILITLSSDSVESALRVWRNDQTWERTITKAFSERQLTALIVWLTSLGYHVLRM